MATPHPKVLHAGAEVYPLVKTGGLADVLGALPQALIGAGADVRLLLPGLPAIVDALTHQTSLCEIGPAFGAVRAVLRLGRMPGSGVAAYVVDAPMLFRRPGNPYLGPDGRDWPDNLQRFALLGRVAAGLAAGELDRGWQPDVLHLHDWHAAMACAYLRAHPGPAARTVYTIHNLAYQGLFPLADFALLGLPSALLTTDGLEFHQQVSFMKAGLQFADRITTVSPSYAREIATPAFGCGLDGVIRARAGDVSGLLNGVDGTVWDPARDPALAGAYSAAEPAGKALCKAALQREFGLAPHADAPLFAIISRLTEQKGLDLVLAVLPGLIERHGQLVLLGTGEPVLEAAFQALAAAHPRAIGVRIGYDETLAHRIVAGADAILVPSRFEPCGLTQLYGLRYGTLPVVRRVGGLADTVVDALGDADDPGTGFAFDAATPAALVATLERAVAAYRQPGTWTRMMAQAMAQDFSWNRAALGYFRLYDALSTRSAPA